MYEWLTLIFFFQAEDGIRDWSVTGVQTCALPISSVAGCGGSARVPRRGGPAVTAPGSKSDTAGLGGFFREITSRSEERRVGKECRSRWSAGPLINHRRQG